MGEGGKMLKKLLKKTGVYNLFRGSRLFSSYERLFKPGVIQAHKKEVGLYKSILPHCHLIFDIGAFDGHKTAAFLELCDQVAAEPDPTNFDLLKKRFGNKKNRVILCPVALSDAIGKSSFFVHRQGSAFNTLNPEWKTILEADRGERWKETIRFLGNNPVAVQTTTLDEWIGQYGLPDFIKIDVEGAEKRVLMGLSQRVPCLSFECLLPEFRDDLFWILKKLVSLDGGTVFNVIDREELLFRDFVSYAELLDWAAATDLPYFEVVARANLSLKLGHPCV